MLVTGLHAAHDATKGNFGEAKASAKKIFNVPDPAGSKFPVKTVTVNAVDLDKWRSWRKD